MDEVLIANFMIFQDAVDEGDYDLVIADEAWDVDHYWHEHPEVGRAPLDDKLHCSRSAGGNNPGRPWPARCRP
jgi:hypothetical protein